MPDPSLVCDLHHSSWQHQILNPLSKARDQTRNPMVLSQICFRCATTGTPEYWNPTHFKIVYMKTKKMASNSRGLGRISLLGSFRMLISSVVLMVVLVASPWVRQFSPKLPYCFMILSLDNLILTSGQLVQWHHWQPQNNYWYGFQLFGKWGWDKHSEYLFYRQIYKWVY